MERVAEPETTDAATDHAPVVGSGQREVLDHFLTAAYDDLREVARRQLARHQAGGTLSTTGLVHEAYLKLAHQPSATWRDRGHFFALVALAMRHVLVDRAKARGAGKREGERLLSLIHI